MSDAETLTDVTNPKPGMGRFKVTLRTHLHSGRTTEHARGVYAASEAQAREVMLVYWTAHYGRHVKQYTNLRAEPTAARRIDPSFIEGLR
jgi:hypothetical protein